MIPFHIPETSKSNTKYGLNDYDNESNHLLQNHADSKEKSEFK